MTAKDYLRRIRQLDDAASAAQLELERIESTVTRVTACHKRFFAGKGTDDADRMANAVERLQRARERCNQAIDDYVDYRDHCRELMDMLQSPLHRAVLIGRYIAYQPLDRLAEALHYSARQIAYIHSGALTEFAKIMDD